MFDLLPYELIIDNFAGGGGTSTGLEAAFGRPVDIAINHDPKALAMHRANHPDTKHYCESVWDIDPIEVTGNQPVGLVWLSPDCKHFSKAKGGKPVEKKIRGLAWVALRWAAKTRPRVIMLENVEEFKTWGRAAEDGRPCPKHKGETFRSFVKALRYQGYEVKWRELRACDYGSPTIRKRFFLIARRDGLPIVFPKPTHADPKSSEVKNGKLKPWRTAAECIDWTIPCPSIFERSKPLVDATSRRLANGLVRQVINNPDPFIVDVDSQQVAPVMTEIANASSPRCMSANEPLRTICAQVKGGHHALVTALIEKHSDKNVDLKSLDFKAPDVSAFLTAFYGNEKDGNSLNTPLRTIPTKDRFGLVTVKGELHQIVDIGMRMFQPVELFKAQGFPTTYIFSYGIDEHGNTIKLTKTEQGRMVGNSVCPQLSEALVRANFSHESKYQGAA
ncbi:hypothetical protein P255_02959 [Acinetobacter brisouii CIP 110357]|uniref:DNA (cytosine-5-)-methyltransferase n=1 Tax=Acinetobacter brisouii CIP 110357 TaxID=1341683 RepID=V2UAI3_9GAMM|nr:DNA cytosine methyltransferase [Acinetobacter brisouii]ENV46208.1 hypothetical protein F954_02843 [Acinetobacter brisouii ANC 4119]ESK47477.1 hypothetical protein P255_02959 [Acinetobacter brisouii CIP 110357]